MKEKEDKTLVEIGAFFVGALLTALTFWWASHIWLLHSVSFWLCLPLGFVMALGCVAWSKLKLVNLLLIISCIFIQLLHWGGVIAFPILKHSIN